MSFFGYTFNIFVHDAIQNFLYFQARLQCNFGDDRKRNDAILKTSKTGRGLTIKLPKNGCISCIFI
jgi:hypothetical protein